MNKYPLFSSSPSTVFHAHCVNMFIEMLAYSVTQTYVHIILLLSDGTNQAQQASNKDKCLQFYSLILVISTQWLCQRI